MITAAICPSYVIQSELQFYQPASLFGHHSLRLLEALARTFNAQLIARDICI